MDIEIKKDSLYNLLKRLDDDTLKFVWKNDKIEIIGKYIIENQDVYNIIDHEKYGVDEICFNAIDFFVLNEIDEKIKSQLPIWVLDKNDEVYIDYIKERNILIDLNQTNYILSISIYNYPDEIRDEKNKLLWTSKELNTEYKEIVDKIKLKIKMIEEAGTSIKY